MLQSRSASVLLQSEAAGPNLHVPSFSSYIDPVHHHKFKSFRATMPSKLDEIIGYE